MVDLLTRIGDPSLAARLANALATLDDEERGASAPSGSSTHLQQAWADVTAAARAIATATGTDPLALAVDYDDVTAATADGAVVYIAAAKAGGYALVVASGHDPQFVDLPRFDRATIERLLDAFLPRQGKKPPSPDRRAAGLKWLWDNGMRDLMLDHARGRVVTLVPVGLLGLVPLHAAGDPGDPDVLREEWRHASHFSAVRYAPNARALRWGRETADHLSGPELSLFAASVQRGHGSRSPLFAVVDETNDVARTWKAGTTTPHHECTWAEFRENAPEHNVWHLACHGRAIPDAILASTLHFSDSAVTLRQMLADFGLAPRRLAVLSACESHMTGIANPNEAIGLPSAMIQLGFAGVIAAAWPTSDLATGYLMARFHRYWRQEGDAPVIALTRAQQWLRRATRSELTALLPGLSPILEMFAEEDARPFADPVYWAAFAYTGV
nr:CHAT domain-containing protein [Actinomadura rayongensis]